MTAAAAGEVAAARPDTDLHIAVLNDHREAFFDAGHAQQLVEQWNSVFAGTIDRDRAEGHPEAADQLTGHVESGSTGAGAGRGDDRGVDAGAAAPAAACASSSFTSFARRRALQASGSQVRSVWEFQIGSPPRRCAGGSS
ncbi:hypothetical protein [Streptomyces qinglanensis]|uniref:hypothetical protein n=1 Tax=Streptomyces qinglanensis TaxID=943816 RepID=UPI003D76135E